MPRAKLAYTVDRPSSASPLSPLRAILLIAVLFFPRVRRSTLTIRVALRFDSASASLISCSRCSALSMIITSTALPAVRILTAPSFSPFCFAPPPAPPLAHVVPPPALLVPRPPRLPPIL